MAPPQWPVGANGFLPCCWLYCVPQLMAEAMEPKGKERKRKETKGNERKRKERKEFRLRRAALALIFQ